MGNTSSTNGRPNPDTSRLLLVLWLLHRYWSVVMERRNSMAQHRDKEDARVTSRVGTGTHGYPECHISACACDLCDDRGVTDSPRYCCHFTYSRKWWYCSDQSPTVVTLLTAESGGTAVISHRLWSLYLPQKVVVLQ